MKRLAAMLGSGLVLGTVAVLLVAILLWFGGPFFAFADVKPFESVVARLVAILVLICIWALVLLLRQLREVRADRALGKAEPSDPAARESSVRASAEEATLKQRFDEAVATLRRRKGRRRKSLYALPWYIVIGPPGAGKTTMLVNSGLEFPLAERFGREPLQGVGGTRNCDWWFTEQAVLLDTAGRYTTQDSDRDADAQGWRSFLSLLVRVRKRRPINGVIVAISVQDLLTLSDQDRLGHVRAIRIRLAELTRELGLSFPVYVLVTKCDLVAGFVAYFDDLNKAERDQVWGVTFPLESSRAGDASARLASEFDLLIERLDRRVNDRVAGERDLKRRAAVFAFPQQITGLKPRVVEFVRAIFDTAVTERPVWLRGVYLTSATQEGTPIDRLMASLARTFGVPAAASPPAAGQGKSYFIEQLLKSVVFEEAGLAGVNRRAELFRNVFQLGAYVSVAAVAAGLLLAMAWSYRTNSTYVQRVAAVTNGLEAPSSTSADLLTQLPRLTHLQSIVHTAAEPEPSPPWGMRWGLYQGASLTEAARDAYLRELNSALGPPVSSMLEQRLAGLSASPDALYLTLKAYLMLVEPERLESALATPVIAAEWQRTFAQDPALAEALTQHTVAWLEAPERLRLGEPNTELVERARNSLAQASVPLLMYSQLKAESASDIQGAIRLDSELGLNADKVFFRRSGVALDTPLPAIYTRAAFDAFDRSGKLDLMRRFMEDSWVLGDRAPAMTQTARLGYDVQQLYERDYIRAWSELLEDMKLLPVATVNDASVRLAILGSSTSPLKALIELVDENTNFAKPAVGAEGAANVLADKASGALGAVTGGPPASPKPGTAITTAFQGFHKLLAGPPGAAPIDQLLQNLARLTDRLMPGEGGSGGAAALAQVDRELAILTAQLPGPMAGALADLGAQTTAYAASEVRGELGGRYRNEVVGTCRELIGRRYPFTRTGDDDVALGDFAAVFGRGGVYDAFFQTTLAPLVDTSRAAWRWREEAQSVGAGAVSLGQFQRVDRIRQVFFPPGAAAPAFSFTLTPESLDVDSLRFVLDVDGQQLDYRHGPLRSVAMNWPGHAAGQASFVFEAAGAERPNLGFRGPWAWFRLIDAAEVRQVTPTRFVLTFRAAGHEARVVLDAGSARNPIGNRDYQRFSCG